MEIRTVIPSLAVKILNGTPKPILQSQKAWLEMASDNILKFSHFSSLRIFFTSNFCIFCMPTTFV